MPRHPGKPKLKPKVAGQPAKVTPKVAGIPPSPSRRLRPTAGKPKKPRR